MQHILRLQAQILFEEGDRDGDWVDNLRRRYKGLLPAPVWRSLKVDESMREGFLQWFKWFERFFWFTDDIPRPARMLNRLHELQAMDDDDRAEAYIKGGGTFALVGNIIVEYAMRLDTMVGNGEHAETYAETLDELPTCRNDHEFGFVSDMCGYMRRTYHAKFTRPNREAQAREKALGGRIAKSC